MCPTGHNGVSNYQPISKLNWMLHCVNISAAIVRLQNGIILPAVLFRLYKSGARARPHPNALRTNKVNHFWASVQLRSVVGRREIIERFRNIGNDNFALFSLKSRFPDYPVSNAAWI